MHKILITNDDGITTDGIVRLATCAKKFGEVVVVAPENQCSAMSHRITLREPIEVWEHDFPVAGVKAYATSGTPADCVRFGLLNIAPESDVVMTGINFGFNSGTDIQYSATVGSALEAASVGVHAIAFSEGMNGCHEVTDAYLEQMMGDLIDRKLDYNQVWNVNFPQCKLEEFEGILEERTIARNAFYHDSYAETKLPNGHIRLDMAGEYYEDGAPGTDVHAIITNHISVGIVNNYK